MEFDLVVNFYINFQDTEYIASEMNNYSAEAIKKKKARIEALQSMSNQERTDHIFARFEILVDMLELECVLWLSSNADITKIRFETIFNYQIYFLLT